MSGAHVENDEVAFAYQIVDEDDPGGGDRQDRTPPVLEVQLGDLPSHEVGGGRQDGPPPVLLLFTTRGMAERWCSETDYSRPWPIRPLLRTALKKNLL